VSAPNSTSVDIYNDDHFQRKTRLAMTLLSQIFLLDELADKHASSHTYTKTAYMYPTAFTIITSQV
jgi:hypothetical protein